MTQRVAVIGAGVAGLTTAFYLKKAGWDVTVYEASQEVGGAIKTRVENGFTAELGPNTVLETSTRIAELIDAAGLNNEKIYANADGQKRFIVKHKKPVALPGSPLGFILTPLFSLGTKLGLIKEPFIPAWDNSYEESLADFVLRRLGQEFLDYAINPFVAGVYAGDPRKLSVKHGFAKLYALEQKYGSLIKGQIQGARERKKSSEESKQSAKMISFKKGLSTLPETLASKLGSDLKLGALVQSMTRNGHQWKLLFSEEGSQAQEQEVDHIIYAGPVHKLASIQMNGEAFPEFEALSDVHHPPVTTMTLGFKRDQIKHALDGFGMLVPEVEGLNILGALFTSTLFDQRAPDGYVTITVFIGGVRQPELTELADEELLNVVLSDLNTLLEIEGKPVQTFIQKWSKAIPQYNVGYGKYKTILGNLETSHSGLHFAGNYLAGISVADTIKHASELTDALIAQSK